MGNSSVPVDGYRAATWMHSARDLVAAFQHIRAGSLTLSDYVKSFHSPIVFAAFAWDDPLPGLLELPLSLYRALIRRTPFLMRRPLTDLARNLAKPEGLNSKPDFGRVSKTMIRATLETLHFSGGHRAAKRFLSGVGAILTLHHVRPARSGKFQPNRSLEITPEFLEDVIVNLKRRDIALVSLDEVHRQLAQRDFSRRFVALTFDDGYRDNLEFAWPILKRHGVPFTLFLPSTFADGTGELWWIALERAIAASHSVEVAIGSESFRFDTAAVAGKNAAYQAIYWRLRGLDSENEIRAIIQKMADRAGVDTTGICREFCMDWNEVRAFVADPLVTIGAHTHSHIMLRKAAEEHVRAEMKLGRERTEAMLGFRPHHFAFPVGDPSTAGPREFAIAEELGFSTAVTTRPGVLFPDHVAHLHALPRLSVNGEFQRFRYLDVLLSGAPTALMNRFRRVSAA